MNAKRRDLTLKLSACELSKTRSSKAEPDFPFCLGSACCKSPWFVAAFLSARITQIHSKDPTVNKFAVETDPKRQIGDLLLP
jgi:hypothetical protein